MMRTTFSLIFLLAALLGLAACQSTPEPVSRNTVLQSAGFVQSSEGWEFSTSEKLLFEPGESNLMPAGRETVNRITHLLIELEVPTVRIDGHTDTTGSVDFNNQLSLRRAQAVADVMVEAGMPAAAITVRGLGSQAPVASNQTAEGRAQNRRVVVVIVGN
ncbi:MAG: OmpA family protein [Betaproteobacteria bacterium]|nr:OmpA family protein [Betaproteobacteria bacterium]MCL2887130.1 OmpA family protein [Betaproteobacteria bacterium]